MGVAKPPPFSEIQVPRSPEGSGARGEGNRWNSTQENRAKR